MNISKNRNTNIGEWVYIFIILFILLALFLYLIKILEFPHKNTSALVSSILFSFPFVAVMTVVNYYFVKRLNRIKFLAERVILRLISGYIYAVIIASLFVLIGNIPFKSNKDSLIDFLSSGIIEASFITAILINIVSITLLEFIEQNKKNKQKEIEYAQLEKQNLLFQYDVLKEQINPHFLFNCFSILNSLINKDVRKATEFIHHLSDIYRYVLSHNANALVKLKDELTFIDSYITILKFRFVEGLKIKIKINDNDVYKQIIPMTLQLLIENAVKHNKISENEPLTIKILSDGQHIIVTNTINRKNISKSTSIGLKNLKDKYRLINSSQIEIEDNSLNFTVKIPLI